MQTEIRFLFLAFFLIFLYLYDTIPDIHLLYLLAMGDGIEFHFSLFDEIF